MGSLGECDNNPGFMLKSACVMHGMRRRCCQQHNSSETYAR